MYLVAKRRASEMLTAYETTAIMHVSFSSHCHSAGAGSVTGGSLQRTQVFSFSFSFSVSHRLHPSDITNVCTTYRTYAYLQVSLLNSLIIRMLFIRMLFHTGCLEYSSQQLILAYCSFIFNVKL